MHYGWWWVTQDGAKGVNLEKNIDKDIHNNINKNIKNNINKKNSDKNTDNMNKAKLQIFWY